MGTTAIVSAILTLLAGIGMFPVAMPSFARAFAIWGIGGKSLLEKMHYEGWKVGLCKKT